MTTLTHSFTFSPNTSINSAQVNQNFLDTRTVVNGGLDNDNLSSTAAIAASKLATAVKEQVGVNDGSVIRRGKSIIATEEARTNTAYGTLTTPDQVTGVVLPTDGLIVVAFQAMWKESVDAAARAALFIGANQLKIAVANSAAPAVQEARCMGAADTYVPLTTGGQGLAGAVGALATAYTGHVTTGQAVGVANNTTNLDDQQNFFGTGFCHVFAAAGTYTVAIMFKSTSGSVTAKERKLWVEARGF